MSEAGQVRHFFVDEAGDFTLFNARGASIIGREGVSRTIMLGVAVLPDPEQTASLLDRLRSELLADPYLSSLPSMKPEQGKTALFFHAKDDAAEVRYRVFRELPRLGAEVQVVVRRKDVLATRARALFAVGQKLREADVYDDMVRRLFKNMLHQADSNEVWFARRGKSDRGEALLHALQTAKARFNRSWGTDHDKPTLVRSASPSECPGLQVIDYFLWALQRLFERGESRFFDSVRDSYRLIMDVDDTRHRPYGEWYSARNPISAEKIKPLVG